MDIFEQIATCVTRGKIQQDSPYPPDMRGQDGVLELVRDALAGDTDPNDILTKALMVGMSDIGKKFSRNEVFVPDLLMAAKAMTAGMDQLKPHFESGAAKRRGVFIIGTVQGDLHDIGKNLVRMMMEGAGYEVIDMGVDVAPEAFLAKVDEHPGSIVGLSALLTTTMVNMESTTKLIKDKHPDALVVVGGAPLTQEFCEKIGADAYSPDPQGIIEWLDAKVA